MPHMQPLWQALYDDGADIALGGHWHNYERLAPMDATAPPIRPSASASSWSAPAARRSTGFGTILPTSQVRNDATYGVMKFTLHAVELRLAVHPDRRPDVHRLGQPARARLAA